MIPPPEPIYFGEKTRPLFGWLHRTAGAPLGRIGMVICNPFGYEEICAHRSIKKLAEAAAAAGIAVLRFDYDGTGNSAGTEIDESRIGAWIASINYAADILKGITGITQLSFVGLRLGALLGALAVRERADVAGFVAFAPIVSGRAYVRELRTLRQVARTTAGADDTVLEAIGFPLSPEAQAALADVDLSRLDYSPARKVFVLDRADLRSSDRWSKHLIALGAALDRDDSEDYVSMMLGAHQSVVPEKSIARIVKWVSQLPPHDTEVSTGFATSNAAATSATFNLTKSPGELSIIHETAIRFGTECPLFGIVSTPQRNRKNRTFTKAFVLINAGAVHQVGPSRLYVALARHWASVGHIVLRMDLSGLGESPPRPGSAENVVYGQHAFADIRDALEHLRKAYGVRDFYALGLCSGAYHSFKAAVAGLPLAGVIVINPLTFFWREGMSLDYADFQVAADMQSYRRNVFSLQSWKKMLRGKVNFENVVHVILKNTAMRIRAWGRELSRALRLPLLEDLGRELKLLAARPALMLFVFAADDPGLELLKAEAGSVVTSLVKQRRLDIRVIEDADHTFTDRFARAKLIEVLSDLDEPSRPF